MKPINLQGKKFGHLTVGVYDVRSLASGHAKWICRCRCGRSISVRSSHLKDGSTISCGCYAKEMSSIRLKKYASSDKHTGEGNPMWKGEDTKYASLHTWLNRWFKKEKCDHCGKKKKTLDWALLFGKKHTHSRFNYLVLCRSCHMKYDNYNRKLI